MNYDEIDIRAFLRASVPRRFQDLSPYDFEAFMAWLFRQDGYEVEETSYSGDFGADLLLSKKGKKTVVQVKRYAPGTQVGVGDVNQVIGASTYYSADDALMITTSDFTGSAIALAKSAEVVLWNWQRLLRYFSAVLLDGESIETNLEEDLAEITTPAPDDWFTLNLAEIISEGFTYEGHDAIEVRCTLENTSEQNLTLHLDLPVVISRKSHRQVAAVGWKDHYFFHGMVVSEATVEVGCYFLTDQIGEIRPGDRLLMRVHVTGQPPLLLDEVLKEPKRSCYIITYCYGRESLEYTRMISFRDNTLMHSSIGIHLVRIYYRLSPSLVAAASKSRFVSFVLRLVTRQVIRHFNY
jgi:hypothetical protein